MDLVTQISAGRNATKNANAMRHIVINKIAETVMSRQASFISANRLFCDL